MFLHSLKGSFWFTQHSLPLCSTPSRMSHAFHFWSAKAKFSDQNLKPPEAKLKGEWEQKSLPSQQDEAWSLLWGGVVGVTWTFCLWHWPTGSCLALHWRDPCRFAHLAALHESVRWQENHQRLFASCLLTSFQTAAKEGVLSLPLSKILFGRQPS